jgi:molecular chaperone GrpE
MGKNGDPEAVIVEAQVAPDVPPATPDAVPDDVVEPDQVLADLEHRLRRLSSAYQQLQSEMAAARDRSERLQAENERHVKARVVTTVFEPVQNLRRSIEALSHTGLPPEVIQGLGLVLTQFQTALGELGLEEISTSGVPFDPNLHEALATVDVPMAAMDGMVVQVFDAGYRIGSQLVQPARVIVGRYHEEAPVEPESR